MATVPSIHGAADENGTPLADTYREAEITVLRQAQSESFKDEITCLKIGRSLSLSSPLLSLSPELELVTGLICVGGRLRQSSDIPLNTIHPIVLDPAHATTKLLIKHYNKKLQHPGRERLFAELRRKYWILRG